MNIRTKTFLLEPGEELLLSSSALEVTSRFDQFVTASGLPPEHLLGDPLCATPIPLYRKDDAGNLRRFENANAAFMWHPLMWLPTSTALRYQVLVEEGSEELRLESDHEWSIRVALELRASGLYNPVSGEWMDVLAFHGIDIDNPVDFARVEAWLSGGADEVLDAIDLSDMVTPDPENYWSLLTAIELAPVFVPAQWHLTAASLLEALGEEDDEAAGSSDVGRLARALTELSYEMLGDVPEAVGHVRTTEDQLLDIYDAFELPGADAPELIAKLRSLLTAIRDDYAIAFETVKANEEES